MSVTTEAPLRRWVADVSVAGFEAERPLTHYPDAAATLVFRTRADRQSDLTVMGPRTRAAYYAGKDIPLCVKVRIRPGRARPLLGVPVSELLNRSVPLDELWGDPARRLAEELARLGDSPGAVLARIETALSARLAAMPPGDLSRTDLLQAATQDLSAADRPSVRAVAERLGVSERQLRNLFTSGVGLSPSGFTRINRVRTVLANTHDDHLARRANTAGYYDQSHMTAEFRALMGVPPGAFLAGHLPTAHPC